MMKLSGSEKQIAWAESIREDLIEDLNELLEEIKEDANEEETKRYELLLDTVTSLTTSQAFIRMKGFDCYGFVFDYNETKQKLFDIVIRFENENK